jgi:lysozyme
MKKILFILSVAFCFHANAQTCNPTSGGCSLADTNSTGQYPTGTFSTTSNSWTTVSAYMNGGNWTLFYVVSGQTYQWTYCSDFGGTEGWDAELTLYDASTGTKLCYANNCGRTNCPNAPYLAWTATFTGTVKLLTTQYSCQANTGSPYSTLVWTDSTGSAPAGGTTNAGVDVSSYQGTINWAQVKAAGATFAWAKATEGLSITDADYHNNAVNGVAAGVYMGAYHFAHPDENPTNADAIAEANYFLSVAQPYIVACELPPVLDYEVSPSLTWAEQATWIQNWMTTVKTATGITPALYTDGSIASNLGTSLIGYPLWIATVNDAGAAIPPSPAPAAPSASDQAAWNPNWSFNQYSWTTTVAGISGQIDADVFNGTVAQLRTLMGCSTTTDIDQESLNNAFNMYPNPSSNSFHIDYAGINGEAVVNVYDINGRLVLTQNMNGKTVIDANSLNDGIYNINITNSDGVVNKRLVIAK